MVDKKYIVPVALLIFLISFFTYASTLSFDFVHDDHAQVEENAWVAEPSRIKEAFTRSVWSFKEEAGGSNFYRPMMHVSFMLTRALLGPEARPYHLVNITIHSLNAVLLFLITLFLFSSRGFPFFSDLAELSRRKGPEGGRSPLDMLLASGIVAPFIAAMVLALHPVAVEPAAWISAVPELSYTFFVLAAFYLYIRSERPGGGRSIAALIVSILFFFVALLYKEPAAVLLLIIAAYDLVRGRFSIKRLLPYLGVFSIYLVMRFNAIGSTTDLKIVDITTFEALLNIPVLFIIYLQKLIWPSDLSIIYSYEPVLSLTDGRFLFSLLVSIVSLVILYLLRSKKPLFFGLLWIVFPLLPVLYLPAVSVGGYNDRYLYLSTAGFGIVLAFIFMALSLYVPRKLTRFLLFLYLVIFAISFAAVQDRLPVWKGDLALWTDAEAKYPEQALTQGALGTALRNNKDIKTAIVHYKRAVELDPLKYKYHYNLALAYQDLGQVEKAISTYETVVRLKPDNDRAHYNLAINYSRTGDHDKAIVHYQEAIKYNRTDDRIYFNLGLLYHERGDLDNAQKYYAESTRLNPSSERAYYYLARLYEERKEPARAKELYRKVLSINPRLESAYFKIGMIESRAGNRAAAIDAFSRAIEINPKAADSYLNIAIVHLTALRLTEAKAAAKRALEIDPTYQDASRLLDIIENKRGPE